MGAVVQHGDNKSINDVVSHLAQRFFDQSPQVRLAVTCVVGQWLCELPDRYSYFHKLIPLLLTSMNDEVMEVREKAQEFWEKAGQQYARENEADFKDKMDFPKPDSANYFKNINRPSFGCRMLVQRHFYRILPGLSNDICDWQPPTRIKSASLLYILLLHVEENATSHLEALIVSMARAACDDEKEVVSFVKMSAEVLGYFVRSEVWCKLLLPRISSSESHAPIFLLASFISGTNGEPVSSQLPEIIAVLSNPDVCRTFQHPIHENLLSCINAILQVASSQECHDMGLQMFTVLVSLLSLTTIVEFAEKVTHTMEKLASTMDLPNCQELYALYSREILNSMQSNYQLWAVDSPERNIFATLLSNAGISISSLIEEILPAFVSSLHPDKDPELKLKMFTLLSSMLVNTEIFSSAKETQRILLCQTTLTDIILPNLVWKGGRTAAAVRTSAISCLWALLQSGLLHKEMVTNLAGDLFAQLNSLLEDEALMTRLITCKVFVKILPIIASSIDEHHLHNFYPSLLKRMDDVSDDVRMEITRVFTAYFDSFIDYKPNLYSSHLHDIYKMLLVHMDDPNGVIQEAVFDLLKKISTLQPSILIEEIKIARTKHRNPVFCDQLLNHLTKYGSGDL